MRLREILIWRWTGRSPDEVRDLLDDPDRDISAALRSPDFTSAQHATFEALLRAACSQADDYA